MCGSVTPSGGIDDRSAQRDQRAVERSGPQAAGEDERAHRLARRQQVGEPGGRSQVVLEHGEAAVGPAHEVGAGDVGPHPRRAGTSHDRLEPARFVDHPLRDDPGGEDPPLGVEIGEELVQRPDPLDQTRLDLLPLVELDDARNGIDRERVRLGAAEDDAAAGELDADPFAGVLEGGGVEAPEQAAVGAPGLAIGGESLVERGRGEIRPGSLRRWRQSSLSHALKVGHHSSIPFIPAAKPPPAFLDAGESGAVPFSPTVRAAVGGGPSGGVERRWGAAHLPTP